ncbi:MAG: hypothetical protein K6G42_11525 [Lachnospiraceae bacterium]|nr:hypothetical protein [Lachnospiraceae bacterium]
MRLQVHAPEEVIKDEDTALFFEKIHKLDVSAYSPEDAGEITPMIVRYAVNKETYVYVTDEDRPGEIVGYLNFFPCSDPLKKRILDPESEYRELDDGITPDEIVPFENGKEFFVYLLSVVIEKEYRDTGAVKLLTDSLASFLRRIRIRRKCSITGIAACAVSEDGVRLLKRLGFHERHELKPLCEGCSKKLFICDNSDAGLRGAAGSLSQLIYSVGNPYSEKETCGQSGQKYLKTWEDDVYLYLPMTEHAANTKTDLLFEPSMDDLLPIDKDARDRSYDPEIAGQIIGALEESIGYECSSASVRDMRVHFLGCYDFLHTTDEYPCIDREFDPVHDEYLTDDDLETDDSDPDARIRDKMFTYRNGPDKDSEETVAGLQKGYVFITSHRPTHMYVVNVFFSDYKYSTTQLEDQVSNNYIKIVDPRTEYDPEDENAQLRFIKLYDYLWSKYLLHRCGQEKIMLCMSGKPDETVYPTEFENVLSAEVYNSLRQDFHIDSESLRKLCETNHAQYDYYSVYLSKRVIAFIPDEWGDFKQRVAITSTYSFIAELVMLQNTALARMNAKVSDALYKNDKVTMEEVMLLEQEYGKTIPFWEPGNFSYLGTANEAKCIREAFSNDELLEMYNKNQDYLEHMVDLMTGEQENRNSMILNIAATILAVIQVESFVTDILIEFYEGAGIELDKAYEGFGKSFDHLLLGGLLLIVIYLVIRNRKHRREMKRRR